MEWEGPDALEPIEDPASQEPTATAETQTTTREDEPKQAEDVEGPETKRQQRSSPAELSESSDDESGDEYVDVADRREDASGSGPKRKVRHRSLLPRRCHVLTTHSTEQRPNNRRIAAGSSSDSDDDDEKEKATATAPHGRQANVAKKISTSPQPLTLKRKQSISTSGVAASPTATKRKRAESSSMTASATEDAARKYCLGKFTEMFTGIFMQYPHVLQESTAEEEEGERKEMIERKPEELTDEDRTQLRERAAIFATEVEQAVFETYAEPDRHGKPGAGVKYKYAFQLSARTQVLMTMPFFLIPPTQGALSHTYV